MYLKFGKIGVDSAAARSGFVGRKRRFRSGFVGRKRGLRSGFLERKRRFRRVVLSLQRHLGYDIKPAQTQFITGGNWVSMFDLEPSQSNIWGHLALDR